MATKRLKIGVMLYLNKPQRAAVERLSKATRIPQQVLLREGVDMLLRKYSKTLRKGGSK